MDIVQLLISLVSGAVGGNVVGALVKKIDLGTLGNSIAGILGGGLGGAILQKLGIAASPAAGTDLSSIVGAIASGGVGGGVLMAIISVIKQVMGKNS